MNKDNIKANAELLSELNFFEIGNWTTFLGLLVATYRDESQMHETLNKSLSWNTTMNTIPKEELLDALNRHKKIFFVEANCYFDNIISLTKEFAIMKLSGLL